MKCLIGFILAGALIAGSPGSALARQSTTSNSGVKQSAKNAAHSTKQAAKSTGKAVKKGTKKVVHKTARATKKGAGKVEKKTQ